MSNKEQAFTLLEKVPESKMGYAIAFLQGLTVDEEADDIYCASLLKEYLSDSDTHKHDTMSLSDFVNEQGISL